MNQEIRTVLLTSTGLRHRYLAREIAKKTNLVGVVCEEKAPVVANPQTLSQEEQAILAHHLAQRDAAEKKHLGDVSAFPDTAQLQIANGCSNSPEVFEWVIEKTPDFVLLYGSSIIKPPLLEYFDGSMVNLHLGLSPYYRGSGTNFWPLVFKQPECVGATIHLAVLDVDAGAVLAQVRPEVKVSDNAHDLGTKTIMSGAAALPLALELFAGGEIAPQKQDLSQGKVFKRRDFNAAAVTKMWQNFDNAMMNDYLNNASARCAEFPIVELDSGAHSR